MDRHPIKRAGDARRRPGPALLAIVVAGLLAACGATVGPGFSGDPCSLITTAELEAAIGGGNVAQSPEPSRESSTDSGCAWTLNAPADPVGDTATLTIMSPGGAADFASTRQFLQALEGSPDPGATASPAAGSSLGPDAALGISLQSVPGLGDDAFVGAAGTVYTIKGDTELELQLIAFDDPNALQHTIDLLKKALARLP
jgi:hypothetical protein